MSLRALAMNHVCPPSRGRNSKVVRRYLSSCKRTTPSRRQCESIREEAATNPNPKVRKSGAVAKAVLASMVLEEECPIRAARGKEDSSDIRRANHPAKGPAPHGSIKFSSVPVFGFYVTKIKITTEGEGGGGDEQARATLQQCAK